MNRPSNMKLGLCWYQESIDSRHLIYDLTDHIRLELKTMIMLVALIFIIGPNLYELQPMDERAFHDFIE